MAGWDDLLNMKQFGPNPWVGPEYQPKGPIVLDGGGDSAQLQRGEPGHNPWVSDEASKKAQSEVTPGTSPGWLDRGVEWAARKAQSIDPFDLFGGQFD
jgi:hypothetical protein